MTPLPFYWPLGGGLLIGLAAAVMLLVNGRVAGVSGLTASALGLGAGAPRRLGLGFLAGLLGGALLAQIAIRQPQIEVTASPALLIVGGLLVGFGTRLGSGCTSGHGVCGMARLSPRSLTATGIFMATAAIVVFVFRHAGAAG